MSGWTLRADAQEAEEDLTLSEELIEREKEREDSPLSTVFTMGWLMKRLPPLQRNETLACGTCLVYFCLQAI